MRMTFICPEHLCDAANHLFMALGADADEGRTFAAALWRTEAKERFAAASLDAPSAWLAKLEPPLLRPDWDADGTVDLAAAHAAAARLEFGADAPDHPMADRILVVTGTPGWQVLAELGLQMVDPDEAP
jgi:hypothetical protein